MQTGNGGGTFLKAGSSDFLSAVKRYRSALLKEVGRLDAADSPDKASAADSKVLKSVSAKLDRVEQDLRDAAERAKNRG